MKHYGLLSGEIAKIDTARGSAPRLVDARNLGRLYPVSTLRRFGNL